MSPADHRIRIRSFRFPEDYDSVLALWSNAGPGVHVGRSDSPEEIRKKLDHDPDLFLLAEVDGRLAGTVIGGFDGRRGMIYHLAVDRALRRRGIGRLLMDELENRLRARGCLKAYLLVVPDNEGALQFYESCGWGPMDISILAKEFK